MKLTDDKLKAYQKAYYQKHKEKLSKRNLEWTRNNPERNREFKLAYKARNKERSKAYNKQWAQENSGKVTAYARKYQASKLNAVPKWLSVEQLKAISDFYINRPKGYHVDHIIPLQGKNVSGLHVIWNLQYLSSSDNQKKSNK